MLCLQNGRFDAPDRLFYRRGDPGRVWGQVVVFGGALRLEGVDVCGRTQYQGELGERA